MAEPDLRDKFRELKRLKRLEQRRIKRREEKQRKETAELYPLAARLFAFFTNSPREPGRPRRTEHKIKQDFELAYVNLIIAFREIRSSLVNPTVRDLDSQIAATLLREAGHNPKVSACLRTQRGELPVIGYLRGRVANLIGFAEKQLGPSPPGRENRSPRNRAIDLILWYESERAPYAQAKLKK